MLGDPRRATLIDIRTAEEFGGPLGHIAGSINIPIAEISRRFSVLLEIKGPVITIGRVEKRSASAVVLLSNAGFAAGIRFARQHRGVESSGLFRHSLFGSFLIGAASKPALRLRLTGILKITWRRLRSAAGSGFLERRIDLVFVCRRADILRSIAIQVFSSSP